MSGHIFNIQDDGTLVEMNVEPFENEDIFQELLERYPNLLAGDQINSSDPRRWLLVKREMGVPSEDKGADRWSLDHLFIDQDAIPTLVEVKRASDTRIRREVVGQMLDYAANSVIHWPLEKIQAEYEKQCSADGADPDERLEDFLTGEKEPEDFWQAVKTNLQAGKIRMLFVADVIPPELRRIVEFLNVQTDPAEVLAVEIKHFVGTGLKTLVPRIIGQTAEAESRKSGSSAKRNPPLSEAELQEIANGRGVGELYASLVEQLRPLFKRVGTSRSTITFNDRVKEAKTDAAAISLTPEISTKERGVRVVVFVDRVAELFQLEKEQVIETMPNCDHENPEWAGYRAGFAPPDEGLSKLIELMKQARSGAPN